MMRPEVVFLRPADPSFDCRKAVQWFTAFMVEAGVDFAFDDRYELPQELPDDLTSVKVVIMHADDEAHYRKRFADRLEHFVKHGGEVAILEALPAQQIKEHHPIYRLFSIMMTRAGVTFDHPALRKRLQNRTFQEVFQLAQPNLDGRIASYSRPEAEYDKEPYTYGGLLPCQALAELEPDGPWFDMLRGMLDVFMAHARDASPNALHGMPSFFYAARRSGNQAYAEWAVKRIRRATGGAMRIHGTIQTLPERGQNLWNESLAHLSPAMAAFAQWTGETAALVEAVTLAERLHAFNYDPSTSLWFHAGRPDYHTPVLWGRGQAWALFGLVGLFEHMPKEHPKRSLIAGYIREVAEGLQRVQDEEGLWGNVLDDPRSRRGVRACAMLVASLARARRHGAISPDFDGMIQGGWKGVRGRMWPGSLCCMCGGTGPGTYFYYTSRPFTPHGSAEGVHAGAEAMLTWGKDGFLSTL